MRLVFLLGIALLACTPEEQLFTDNPDARLRFSADSVLFDTVFTEIPSITRRFRVYNDNNGAVTIADIGVAGGSASPYRLTINGISGHTIPDQRLLRGDSMLVLVDALIDPGNQNLPFVVEDSVLFSTNGNQQGVYLAAWGQDAVYLQDSVLECSAQWTAEKPYVIYNSVLVDSLCTLDVEAGARIYSHKNSSIFVKGTIKVEGTADERVIFRNDRLDEDFENAPGQWDGIFFLPGSKDNLIRYADVRNSEYGVWLGTPDNDTIPDLVLEQVKFENMSRSGIIAFTSDLRATNVLVNNTIEYAVANLAGGHYSYEHCTFANYSTFFFSDSVAFIATDRLMLGDGSEIGDEVHLTIANSIIYGDATEEVIINNDGGNGFVLSTGANIFRTTLDLGEGNLYNTDPRFVDIFDFNYRVDSLSPAIDAGLDLQVPIDLDGITREIPDIGAYEWKSNQ